jgi:hypothetical protein
VVGYLRRTDGAQQQGVLVIQLSNAIGRKQGATAEQTLASPIKLGPNDAEAMSATDGLEHLYRRGNYLLTDPITRDQRDAED